MLSPGIKGVSDVALIFLPTSPPRSSTEILGKGLALVWLSFLISFKVTKGASEGQGNLSHLFSTHCCKSVLLESLFISGTVL